MQYCIVSLIIFKAQYYIYIYKTKINQMKAAICTIIGLFFYFNGFSQAIPDSVAIKQLLLKESTSYHKGDLKARAECWQIQPYSRIVVSTAEGRFIEVPLSSVTNPPANFQADGSTVIFTNIKIGISGNGAWVSHDQETDTKDGKKYYSTEFKMLEKIKAQWKFVGMSIHGFTK